MPTSFKLTEDKLSSQKIRLMQWSSKMDLIAIATTQQDIALHRLNWEKVWSQGPPTENFEVTGMAWRDDSKLLAVGYSLKNPSLVNVKCPYSGKVLLYLVEDAKVVHEINCSLPVMSIGWSFGSLDLPSWTDNASNFIPKLPEFPETYNGDKAYPNACTEDVKILKTQKQFSILMIGQKDGMILLYAHGILKIGQISTEGHDVVAVSLSSDLTVLAAILRNEHELDRLTLHWFNVSKIANKQTQFHQLCLQFGQILSDMDYLTHVLLHLQDCWEDILLDIDEKFKSVSQVRSLSNDLRRLLLFGVPSSELRDLLQFELTEKNIKKLKHSFDNSYSNLQRLLLKHFDAGCHSILYRLNEIRGVACWTDPESTFGIPNDFLHQTVQLSGSLALKTSEMLDVICNSKKRFQAFFSWLSATSRLLANERPSIELSKMTMEQVNFVMEFLEDCFPQEPNQFVSLERVGQYLKEENLSNPVPHTNDWQEFLSSSNMTQEFYPLLKEKSFVGAVKMLQGKLDQLVSQCDDSLSKNFAELGMATFESHSYGLSSGSESVFILSSINDRMLISQVQKSSKIMACEVKFLPGKPIEASSSQQSFLDQSSNGCCEVDESQDCQFVVAVCPYDQQTLTVLLKESTNNSQSSCILLQCPLTLIVMSSVDCLDDLPTCYVSCDNEGLALRHLDSGFIASSLAVSGSRETACVLNVSGRRVKLFLMNDDEEEDSSSDVLGNSSLESHRPDASWEEDKENLLYH